jgi:hypothetical protein
MPMNYLVFIQKENNEIARRILSGGLQKFLAEIDREFERDPLHCRYCYEKVWNTGEDEPDWFYSTHEKIIFRIDFEGLVYQKLRYLADSNDLPHIEIDDGNGNWGKFTDIALLIGPFDNEPIEINI